MHPPSLTPEAVLFAYRQGAFPMTDDDGYTRWYTADPRGIIPLVEGKGPGQFRVSRSLRQAVDRGVYDVTVDRDFVATMRACMTGRPDGTWISEELVDLYTALHRRGNAHSVEARDPATGELVGGLYGVSLAGAFFGESMFHRRPNASKVALVHLVRRLRERGYRLLDAQARTRHLATMGCVEVSAETYFDLLGEAMERQCVFA